MKTINQIVKRNIVSNVMSVIKDIDLSNNPSIDVTGIEKKVFKAINNAMGQSMQTEKKVVNILLSDLRGFTSMAEDYSPVVIMNLLNRYFVIMSEIIQKHNGVIDKFMGDSIMVLFGAPNSYDDDLERTLACAIEMQLAMEEINKVNEKLDMPSLYMGIGINTGEVVAGSLGSDFHNEYTVIGDEVNLVSRVEAHSLRGQILLSENTYQKSKDFIEIGDVNEVQVKGKKGAVKMYDLLAINKPHLLKVPCREIRKSPRVSVNIPLSFYCMAGKTILPHEYIGKIIDVSYSGIFTIMPIGLTMHDEVKINFSTSVIGKPIRDVYARVVRVFELEDEHQCHLEFTSIDKESKHELKNYVDLLIGGLI